MSLHLFNSLTRRVEPFEPSDPTRPTMYVCGPTVYNYVHIGNARGPVVFGVLADLLRRRFGALAYARNITDIDDKINAAARDQGVPISAITDRFATAYREDMAALGVPPPDIEPEATRHIAEIIAMIERLIESGHAYVAENHALFAVASFDGYGKLSRRDTEDMLAGARVDVAPYKRDPGDFVLWKPSPDDPGSGPGQALPGWDSPWGRGRPGWHIECSAMAAAHLGETIDIHAGGVDLQFPHHENEIAQSESAHGGKPFARWWLHNGMLNFGGTKMSKSLGNIEKVHDLVRAHPPEALRYGLLSAHYRQPLEWSEGLVEQSVRTLDRLYGTLREMVDIEVKAVIPDSIEAALNDDLNTPMALANIAQINAELGHIRAARSSAASLRQRQKLLRRISAEALYESIAPDKANPFSIQAWVDKKIDPNIDTFDRFVLETSKIASPIKARLLGAGLVLGLLQQDPVAWFARGNDHSDDARIHALVDERNAAKQARDFVRADAIRKQLADEGILLEDTPAGVRWRRA